MPRYQHFLPLFLKAAVLAVLLTSPVHAQTAAPPSSGEDVAIAFFKTGGVTPDFEAWGKGASDYKIAAPTLADRALIKEKTRLAARYRTYDPDIDPLRIRVNVTVLLKNIQNRDGTDGFSMKISLGTSDVTYFPFSFMGYDIALIPGDLNDLLEPRLNPSQFEVIKSNLGGAMTGSAILNLDLKPLKSYIEQPYPLDGKDQWLFMTTPVSLSLRSSNGGAILWSYGASWGAAPFTNTDKLR